MVDVRGFLSRCGDRVSRFKRGRRLVWHEACGYELSHVCQRVHSDVCHVILRKGYHGTFVSAWQLWNTENKGRALLCHDRKLQKCKAKHIQSHHDSDDPHQEIQLGTQGINLGVQRLMAIVNFGIQCVMDVVHLGVQRHIFDVNFFIQSFKVRIVHVLISLNFGIKSINSTMKNINLAIQNLNIRFLRHVRRCNGMNHINRGFRLVWREACGGEFSRFCQRIHSHVCHMILLKDCHDPIHNTFPAQVQALVWLITSVLISLPAPALAQTQDTLGIDCEQPRLSEAGKLIFGDDGADRAMCEADRRTALHYVNMVTETRDRLRQALSVLPPPIWDHLAQHLRTHQTINAWRYTDTSMLTRLQTTLPNIYAISRYWTDGLLNESHIDTPWRSFMRARACGTGRDAVVLIWLDPAAVRDRWTPEMVQRTVRAWKARTEAQYAFDDSIPRVITATSQLQRSDGRREDISSDSTVVSCFSAVPTGALALTIPLRLKTTSGTILAACTGADEIGVRKLTWTRRNSVYIVSPDAITEAGQPHSNRGEPLLGQSAILPSVNESNVADGAFLTSSSCRPPRTLDAVRTADCPATVAGQAVQGKHVRTFRFREVQDDPVDEFRIDMVPVRPGNGELGVIIPAGQPHDVWEETTLFCNPGTIPPSDAPPIPERVADDWGYPRCAAAHGGRFNLGDRYGYLQTIQYLPDWPVDDVNVRHIDDDCFRLDWVTGRQYRAGPQCPAGYTGAIIEARDVRWQDRRWAVPDRQNTAAWDRRLSDQSNPDEAGAVYDVGGTGLDRVILVRDWRVVINNCAAPRSMSGTQTRPGAECPAGQVGEITDGRDLSWYNPGTPSPACATLPAAGRRVCDSVSAQQSPVPISRSVDAAAAAYDSGVTGYGWWDVVTLTAHWREVSNSCADPIETGGSKDDDRDGVEAGRDADDSDSGVGCVC